MISGLPMVLSLDQVNLTDEQFYRLCQANRDIQLERSAAGALIIMSPVGGKSGNREADLITDLTLWNRKTALGKVFSSSTIFKLPNGGDRSPDAAWVELGRWEALTPSFGVADHGDEHGKDAIVGLGEGFTNF